MADDNGRQTQTGGRAATTGHIAGEYALAVGKPSTSAPDGWEWIRLTDVARLETGHTPSRMRPDYWGGDIPWIGIRDATANHGRTLDDTNQHTNQLGIDNSSARVLPATTVCLSRTASVGYVVVMGRPMATSQDFVNWVCSDNLDYRFLKYVLLSERRSFLRFASGTTHQTIYFPEVKAFHVCLPPLSEQRAIANILGSLDDKIELNRRMNETLEGIARALFKSWFVDFDPVRAKMDGRQPVGMSPEIAELFPSELIHVNREVLPKGWTIEPLKKIATLITESVLPNREPLKLWEHYSIPAYDDGKRPMAEQGSEIKSNKFAVPAGSVLVSKLNPQFPRVWLPNIQEPDAAICSTEFMPFVPRKLSWRSFLYETTWSDFFQNEIQTRATGSTGSRQRVKPREVADIPIVYPSDSVIEAFGKLSGQMHEQQFGSIHESETLATLRDTLLPKLLSGELRVPDAERAVEEAL